MRQTPLRWARTTQFHSPAIAAIALVLPLLLAQPSDGGGGTTASRSTTTTPVLVQPDHSIGHGRTIKLRSFLRSSTDGTSQRVASTELRLQRRSAAGRSWTTVASGATAAGRPHLARFDVSPRRTSQFRVVKPGTDAGGRRVSAPVTVRVRSSVTSKLVARGDRWRLSGVVAPAHINRRVILQRRTCGSCAWTKARERLTGDASGYRFFVKPGRTASFRVKVPAKSRLAAGRSRARTVRIDSARLPGWGLPSWRDEFNGTRVDRSKWNVHHNDSVSYDNSVAYASQATPRGGVLRLRAERMRTISHGGKNRSWKSAYLDSVGKFSQRYGRWEMRAKLPNTAGNSSGLWPSFWLRDNSGGGEVDIFEAWGTPSTKPSDDKYLVENVTSTIHQDTYGGRANTKFQWLPTQSAPNPRRLSGGFHTFACEWTPSGFKFFLDGKLMGQRKTSSFPWFRTSFPSSANIRIHYAVGQDYYGQPTARTKSRADYLIDYVRVYRYTR